MRYCGFSEGWHDAGLAFINEQGEIIGAYHAERYTKFKNEQFIPSELSQMVQPGDHLTFYEDPEVRRNSQLSKKGIKYHDMIVNNDLSLKYDNYIEHHVSHAAGAFFTRPWESKDDTVILTIDGVGEEESTVIYDHNFNKLFRRTRFKSIGILYTFVTKQLGLRPMEDEYVVMGLSAYGDPKCGEELYKLFNALPDIQDINADRNIKDRIRNIKKRYSDRTLAASIQFMAEKAILDLAQEARKYGSKLCYSGGVAQNIIANSKIKEMFDEVWIPPACTDAGSALGAAAFSYCKQTGKDRVKWKTPFLGYNIQGEINPIEVVDHILEHKVCGVANGRAEFGPRALGNRSLLGDVRYDVKDTVNEIKQRQRYRPFAPAILAEFADKYFQGPMNEYMQYQASALHDFNSVTHVDGTARVQLVDKDHPSILRKILEEYYDRTGVPTLLNTSLNIRGQPIVNDEDDARRFSQRYFVKVF